MTRPDPLAGFFASPPPRVLAHRGLAIEAPENTLLAFAKAIALGITHVETDVHVSADGVAVVSHDPDLSRVAGREVRVEQLTMTELRKVDLGDGQGFSSLAEALDAFPETCFNIDIKVPGVADPAAAAILGARAVDRVLISSFGGDRRRRVVAQLPGVATSASSDAVVPAVAAARVGAVAAVRRALGDAHAVQLPTRILGARVFTRRSVDAFHAAGVEVHAWTINEPAEMSALLDLGLDGIITDRADLALEVLAAR